MPPVSAFLPKLNQAGDAYVPQSWDPVSAGESVTETGSKVMVNGDVVFNVTGAVQVLTVESECVTPNDATASTVKYTAGTTPVDLCAASSSLASLAAGAKVAAVPQASLATAAAVVAGGTYYAPASGGVSIRPGPVKLVVAGGSTTGTWKHRIRWRAMSADASVQAAQ